MEATLAVHQSPVVRTGKWSKTQSNMQLSIIIPTLDEAKCIEETLGALQPYRNDNLEIVVVDGGSHDGTLVLTNSLADLSLKSMRGRANQMNFGASEANGEYLMFLHADTRVPTNAFESLRNTLSQGAIWGRFDVTLSGNQRPLRMVESLMNWRSKWSGIATGDQAIFVKSDVFKNVGGFPEIPLMEDIALSKKLKRITNPVCLNERVISSSRRWETHGIFRTIMLMWLLRLKYFLGVDPVQLAEKYDNHYRVTADGLPKLDT